MTCLRHSSTCIQSQDKNLGIQTYLCLCQPPDFAVPSGEQQGCRWWKRSFTTLSATNLRCWCTDWQEHAWYFKMNDSYHNGVPVFICFIFSLEIIKATSTISYRRGCCGHCQLCLKCTSESRKELRLALLLILKMSSPVSHAGDGACCSKLHFWLYKAVRPLYC